MLRFSACSAPLAPPSCLAGRLDEAEEAAQDRERGHVLCPSYHGWAGLMKGLGILRYKECSV